MRPGLPWSVPAPVVDSIAAHHEADLHQTGKECSHSVEADSEHEVPKCLASSNSFSVGT